MSENIHDKGYKRILSKKKQFLSLLKDFVHESWVNEIQEDDLEIIDKEFILKDFKEKESDIIYKLTYKGKEIVFYCLIELQSSVDYTMPFRLLIYMVELYRRIFADTDESIRERKEFKLPAIVPIVLYNGDNEWTAVKSFKEYLTGNEHFGKELINFNYILLNVNKYEDEKLLEIGTLISAIFLFDKKQSFDTFINNFERFYNISNINITGDEQLELYDWIKYVLIKKIGNNKENVINKMIDDFKEKGSATTVTYGLERLIDEIKEESEERGKELGEQMGKIEVAKRLLKKGYSIDEINEVTNLQYSIIKELHDNI